ncbi:MAG: hypothetical protein J3K34DRAFT_521052 [Monoraphidium minutum]|nr:MAG: hypothetical protein J3K34DRAFT_521052 [Monoraphidium minutum]
MGKSSVENHQTRLPWTPEEDAILIQMVEKIGEKRWPLIAAKLPGRTGKGCSHRWRTYLRPDVKHPHLEPFTEWEAAVIVQGQKEHANNWLYIAKLLLPGRSNTAVKNYWHCRLKAGVGLKSNSFLQKVLSLDQLLNDVPQAMRTYPIAQPPFPSVAPSKVMAQRIDPKTGLPLPSGPLANNKGAGTFHISVAQVGKPMTGPPPGLVGTDLKAAASQYVQQHLASLGASCGSPPPAPPGAAPRRTGGAAPRGVGRLSSGDSPLMLPPGVGGAAPGGGAGGGGGSALSLGASHEQPHCGLDGGMGLGVGLGLAGMGLPDFGLCGHGGAGLPGVPPMFGLPAFGLCGPSGMGVKLDPGSPQPCSSGAPDDTAAHHGRPRGGWGGRGGGDDGCGGGDMSEDLEEMFQGMHDDDDDGDADGGDGGDDAAGGGSGGGAGLLDGSTAAAAAALARSAGGGGDGGARRSFSSASAGSAAPPLGGGFCGGGGAGTPGSPAGSPASPAGSSGHHLPPPFLGGGGGHHAAHLAHGLGGAQHHGGHHQPSPLSRARAVSPFAACQGGGMDGLEGGRTGSCPSFGAAGLEPCGMQQHPGSPHHGHHHHGGAPPPAHAGSRLRHLLPHRPASASPSLGARTESWEREVAAIGNAAAAAAAAAEQQAAAADAAQRQQEQEAAAAQWQRQERGYPQHAQLPHAVAHRALGDRGRVGSAPSALEHAGGPAGSPGAGGGDCAPIHLHHLHIRLAGVAASAAQAAEEAANGGTPVAAGSPGAGALGMLALSTPHGTPHNTPQHAQHVPQHTQQYAHHAAQHFAQQQQQQQQQHLPSSGGAFFGRAPSGGTGAGGGNAGMFNRQVSLGVQESLPFEWEPFGGAPSMARQSNDDGGAFEALLQ